MKKTVCLVLSLVMLLALCACSKDTPAPQPTETAPQETLDLTIFEKSEGKLAKEIWYNTDGLQFRSVIYEYDENGFLAKETTLGINDAPEGYKEYVRDENGAVTKMTSFIALGPEEFEEEYSVIYKLDAAGRTVRAATVIDSVETAVTEYAYDGDRLVSEKYSECEEPVSETSYAYSDGSVTLTRKNYIEDSTSTETRALDADGRIVSVTRTDSEGNLISRSEFTYDENGSEKSAVISSSDGSIISSTSSEYEYDEPGNVIKCTRSHGEGVDASVIEYTWDYAKG